ncbi:hypothetical protein EAO70_09330 [Streptomyces sp. adm13(2018)]|uniref:hypothetical protein n=1 Tax=Streptomyces sp. adm13(2018) TaxID=2479007 RepID=UPI0013A2199B|nr:hypothetical protein [Streptomyces sp. adm13(2018)]TXS20204.1 hypothetical protein EAO70_09330 [Streptomyces sp. adm13(2018)]
MIIVHTPEGGEVERFDVRSVRTSEASIITRLISGDLSWAQVKARVEDGDPEVMCAVAFVIKKRSEPALRIDDFDPVADELQAKWDHKEIDIWAQIAAERLTTFDGPVEAARPALAMVLDAADDRDYAEVVIERVLAGKFPPAPDETTSGGGKSKNAASTAFEPSTSGSSPTSSTSTEADSTT